MRLCIQCDKLLPLDQFKPNKRSCMCIFHFRKLKLRDTLGTHDKRAFNSLRCRAHADMLLFKQDHMVLPKTLVMTMLTDDQKANFPVYCIIPRRPNEPLTKDNSILVTSIQRKFVVGRWKLARDQGQYGRDLTYILGA